MPSSYQVANALYVTQILIIASKELQPTSAAGALTVLLLSLMEQIVSVSAVVHLCLSTIFVSHAPLLVSPRALLTVMEDVFASIITSGTLLKMTVSAMPPFQVSLLLTVASCVQTPPILTSMEPSMEVFVTASMDGYSHQTLMEEAAIALLTSISSTEPATLAPALPTLQVLLTEAMVAHAKTVMSGAILPSTAYAMILLVQY